MSLSGEKSGRFSASYALIVLALLCDLQSVWRVVQQVAEPFKNQEAPEIRSSDNDCLKQNKQQGEKNKTHVRTHTRAHTHNYVSRLTHNIWLL